MNRRLLFVTYLFPPVGGPGIQRVTRTVKYLSRLGWDVTVLTVADPPSAVRDEALLSQVPVSVRVLRAWSLEPTRLTQAWRRLRGRTEDGATSSSYTGAPSGFVRLVQALFTPDEKRFWIPWGYRAALRAAKETPFDVVVSSGPPFTAHVLARRVAQRLGIPYAVDMRDAWVGNCFFVPLTPLNARLTEKAERDVVMGASLVVTTADSVSADLAARYPQQRDVITSIYNGFDPDDLPEMPIAETDDDVFTLIHTGTFSATRTPLWLIRGLAIAERRRPDVAAQTRLRFVGAGAEVVEMAEREGLTSRVEALGYLPHARSLELLAQSTVATLVVPAGEESRAAIPAKLYDYLALRRPILALIGQGDGRRILEDVSGARVVEPEDPELIAGAILSMFDSWKRGDLARPSEADAKRFDTSVQVARYSDLLEQAIRKGVR